MKKLFYFLLIMLLGQIGWAQTYHNLSGGNFSQDWSNTGLITTNNTWSGVPSIIGYRGDDITVTTGVDPQTLLGEGTVTVNVTANQTSPNTNTTGGIAEFEITNPVVAFQGSGTADAPNIVIFLNTTGVTNIQVQYNLRDIDGSNDNAVQPVALQYRVGTTGNFTNLPAGFVADASSGPSLATLVTAVNVTLPAAAENQAQLQLRIITSNAVGTDEWIGIDDIVISGSTAGLTPPVLTADITNNDVDNNIDITFTDDATWRGLVTAVKIGGTALTLTTDYTISVGNIKLKPSGLNTLLTTSGTKSVTIEATGYSVANVTQIINAGAEVKLAMKTQPAAPAANGGTLATQPAVYIQDQYGNTTSSTSTVNASVGAGSWTLGGTTSVSGVAGTVTYIGLTATSTSAVTGATISFTSGTLTGITSNTFDIPAPVPSLSVTPTTLSGFTYSETAGPSPEKTFTVGGLNLTNDISIAATTNYEISIGSGGAFVATDPIILTQSGGNVATTTIYVRLKAGLSVGTYNSEVINITSTGATAKTVTCSGDVTAWVPGLPLVEDFDYTVGTLLSANGWTNHSGTSNYITVTAPSINYPGYLSSGVGNEVSMTNGADVNRPFVSQASGVLYNSFLVNVTAATETGDYFIHFGETSGASVSLFGGRVWVKKDPSSSNFAFGVSKSSTAANISYTGFDYLVGTTYLVIVKHNFVSGINNDNCALYINPPLNAAEPTPTLVSLSADNASTDPSQYVSICLRQGSTTTAPSLKLDGIRISKVWSDLVGNISTTPTITVNPTSLSGFTYVQGSGPSAEQSFTVSGSNLTDNITLTPPTDYEISTVTGVGFTATNPIVLTQTGGTVNSTPIYVRLKSGLTAGNYNAEQITSTSTGSNNPVVSCSGTVTVPVPVLTIAPLALSGFTTVLGTPSPSQSYSIAGDFLAGNVTATAPAGFEISTDDINYVATLVLTQTGGDLDGEPLTIYARIASSAAAGAVSGDISHTSTNLTQVNVALTGNVFYPEPSNHVSNFAADAPIYSTVNLTWSDNDGVQQATGFLILANTTGVFTPPVDGVSQTNDYNMSDGSGVANVLHGVQTFTWTGLSSSTHYYFEIYPYTNTGANINYKTSPAAPAVDITTPAYILPLAAWTFDVLPATDTTPTSVAANYGIQAATAMLYADGTNGSSLWVPTVTNTELNSFTGTVINDPRESTSVFAGRAYCPVAGASLSANGKSMVIKFSMTNYVDPILTFATRGTSTGFNTHQWEWSTDNITYTPFGVNTAVTANSFVTKTLDMSTIDNLDQASAVYLRVTFSGATNATGNNRLDNIVIRATEAPQTKTLNLKAYLEGLYAGGGVMNQAMGAGQPQWGSGVADKITVELYDASANPPAYTFTDVDLLTNGTASITTLPGTISGSYYIVIKNRNSLETWSATAINFSDPSPLAYDFSTATSQAYGSNQKDMSGVAVIYAGEAVMDGLIDFSDVSDVFNQNLISLSGYNLQDINGDGLVDFSDVAITYNNSLSTIQIAKP